VLHFSFGWLSDRMDRRILIFVAALGGGIGGFVGWLFSGSFEVVLAAGFILGGVSNPLYALLIAYTNDYLTRDRMAGASGGLIFVNGLGAIVGPVLTGWAMAALGPAGFWAYLSAVMFILVAYVGYRMTQRASRYSGHGDHEAVSYAPVLPTATAVAVEAAQDLYADKNAETEIQFGGQ